MLFWIHIFFSQLKNIFAVNEVTEVPFLFFKIFKVNDIIVGKDADLTIVTVQTNIQECCRLEVCKNQ